MQAIKLLGNKKTRTAGFYKDEQGNKFKCRCRFSILCVLRRYNLSWSPNTSLRSSPLLILQAGGTTVFSYLFFNKFRKGELKLVSKEIRKTAAFRGDNENSVP